MNICPNAEVNPQLRLSVTLLRRWQHFFLYIPILIRSCLPAILKLLQLYIHLQITPYIYSQQLVNFPGDHKVFLDIDKFRLTAEKPKLTDDNKFPPLIAAALSHSIGVWHRFSINKHLFPNPPQSTLLLTCFIFLASSPISQGSSSLWVFCIPLPPHQQDGILYTNYSFPNHQFCLPRYSHTHFSHYLYQG